jgi:SAM-dependent methyltransferase
MSSPADSIAVRVAASSSRSGLRPVRGAPAGFVMHLLDDPPAVIAAVRALLKPGGLFAFTTPGRVPDGFEFADIAHDLFGEFARYLAVSWPGPVDSPARGGLIL